MTETTTPAADKPTRRRTLPAKVQAVSFKLPPATIKGLDEMAFASGRSRSAEVRLKLGEIVSNFRKSRSRKAKRAHA